MKRRRFLSLLLSLLLLTGVLVPAGGGALAAGGEISVYVDGEKLAFDQPPIARNGRVLVPFRAIFEKLGAVVEWYPEQQGVAAQKGDTLIVMQLGKNVLAKSVNGGEGVMYELDVAPIALNGRTLVPVRAVSESFNCDVQWDGANNRVVITTGRQTAAVDENRVYFNPGHKTNDYTSGIFDGNTLYFNFVNRAMIYVYDGSSVRSFNAGDHPRDIIARAGMVYYYGHNNGGVYAMDTATGERTLLLTASDLGDDVEELKVYRNYLLASDGDDHIYAVNLDTGAGRMLYDADVLVNSTIFTAAGGKIYLSSYCYQSESNSWRVDLLEADPAMGSIRTLETGVGTQLFCAGDGSGIYYYTGSSDNKTYCFYDAATGARRTVSQSAYDQAKEGYYQTNDVCWTEDWSFGSNTSSGVYRQARDTDLRETLYSGKGCHYLTNSSTQVAFIQSENGFTPGAIGDGWGDTSVYIMDINGNNVQEVLNNGASASGSSGTGDSSSSVVGSEPCAVCGGSGMVTCPYCHGSTYGPSITIMGIETPQKCTYCGGTGQRLCSGCGGSGVKN